MNYSRRWTCWICDESQESIDLPKMQVCGDCMTPVARKLCKDALGVSLGTSGIDVGYWMRQADAVVEPMLRRWQPNRDRAATPA